MCEAICVLFTREVESVDLAVVPPLVECWCSLVVLETLEDRAVYHDLQTKDVTHFEQQNRQSSRSGPWTNFQ